MRAIFASVFMSLVWGCGSCFCATIHIGDIQIPLSSIRHTSPSLVVGIHDTTYFGSLFSDTAPAGTLRLDIAGTQYWLGEYCVPGTYMPQGTTKCADCGLGHYCTGGRHRDACSGGIIGCPGLNASADVSAPKFTNRSLNADEIKSNVPSTNLAQWRQISCCVDTDLSYYATLYNDLSAVNSVQGCANNILAPGTYMFAVRALNFCAPDRTDPIDGSTSSAFSTNIMIFDHAVSYKSIHAANIYGHFLDIDGPDFTEWDMRLPAGSYCYSDMRTNIDDIGDVPHQLCVYELR